MADRRCDQKDVNVWRYSHCSKDMTFVPIIFSAEKYIPSVKNVDIHKCSE